jgi:hypothetical protein
MKQDFLELVVTSDGTPPGTFVKTKESNEDLTKILPITSIDYHIDAEATTGGIFQIGFLGVRSPLNELVGNWPRADIERTIATLQRLLEE